MLDDLLLLRLLCARFTGVGSETRSNVSRDLLPLAGDPGAQAARWRETLAASVDRLTRAGDLATEGRHQARLRITPAGEHRTRGVFGVPADYRPAAAGWTHWRDKFGLSKALGGNLPPDADALRAAMLLRFYLPEIDPTMAKALRGAVDLLLTRKIGVKATPGALRAAALRAWVRGAGGESAAADPSEDRHPPPPAARPMLPADDEAFAMLIRETARRAESARAGDDKVFISHVWRLLAGGGPLAAGGERAFKERLIRANTAGTLRLIRADLAEPSEADDVAASETRYLSERFHYVQLG